MDKICNQICIQNRYFYVRLLMSILCDTKHQLNCIGDKNKTVELFANISNY